MGVRIAIKTFTNPWLYVYCSDFCITALIAFFRIVKRFSSSEAQIWFSVVRNTQEKAKKRKDFIQTFWSLWSFAFEKLKITMIKKFRWNVFAFWYFTEIFLMKEQSNLEDPNLFTIPKKQEVFIVPKAKPYTRDL